MPDKNSQRIEERKRLLFSDFLNFFLNLLVFATHCEDEDNKDNSHGDGDNSKHAAFTNKVTPFCESQTDCGIERIAKGRAGLVEVASEGKSKPAGTDRHDHAHDEGTKNGAFPAAGGVTKDTGSAAGKEGGDHARQDDIQRAQTELQPRTNDHASEPRQEAEQQSGRSVGEDNRAVKGRDSAGNQFLGNTSEGRHDFTEHHADASQNDGHTGSEGQGAHDREDNRILRTGNFCRNIFVGDQGQDEVQGQNGDSQAGVVSRKKLRLLVRLNSTAYFVPFLRLGPSHRKNQ